MPHCSVIVVTYNSSLQIELCLRALAAQDCEIVVVDNASSDDTRARVMRLSETIPLKLVALRENTGFAGGVNEGARNASGDVILLLNPDAIAQPEAIDVLTDCLTRTGAAAAGGALLDAEGHAEKGFTFRRLPTLGSLLFEALLVNQLWPANRANRRYRCLDADYSVEQLVEQPAGACLAVTRSIWEQLGGMDAAFFPVWFEDVDFCKRLQQAGEKIVYCPAATFRHSGAHSVGQLAFAKRQMIWYSNMLRYARRHLSPWRAFTLRIGIVVGMTIRVIASLLGARPQGVLLGEAVGAYAQVAVKASGLKRAF